MEAGDAGSIPASACDQKGDRNGYNDQQQTEVFCKNTYIDSGIVRSFIHTGIL